MYSFTSAATSPIRPILKVPVQTVGPVPHAFTDLTIFILPVLEWGHVYDSKHSLQRYC